VKAKDIRFRGPFRLRQIRMRKLKKPVGLTKIIG